MTTNAIINGRFAPAAGRQTQNLGVFWKTWEFDGNYGIRFAFLFVLSRDL
jgi:hypothetical protein